MRARILLCAIHREIDRRLAPARRNTAARETRMRAPAERPAAQGTAGSRLAVPPLDLVHKCKSRCRGAAASHVAGVVVRGK